MPRMVGLAVFVFILVVGCLLALGRLGPVSEPVTVLGAKITQGSEVYAQFCASCHGVDLEGQPNWQSRLPNSRLPAPPHDETGHTWHHSDDMLFVMTKFGLEAVVPDYQSDMPAFMEVLSDQEIRAVIEFIKSTWPERKAEYQRQITERDANN